MSCPMGYGAGASKAQEENPAIQGVYYADYLELDKILDAQHPKSADHGPPAHDELLFIITHQTYELWFKQILHEVHSVIEILSADFVEERSLGTVVSRLERVTEIQKVLVDQVRILETMLPLDFLDFRKFLNPASGFQSVQFRMLENRLGMPQTSRLNYQNVTYLNYFKYADQDSLGVSHSQPTLLGAVNKWLERTPFLTCAGFDFWVEYREAVKRMLDEDKECTLNNSLLNEESKRDQLASQERTERAFEALFNEAQYNEGLEKGDRRLSYAATKAALLIFLYRDEPVLQLPFRMLTALTDIDELLTTWRYRHTMMVQRMIGVKLGTGGSSGYYYLKATVSDRYKVFLDLFNLSTYLIPRSNLPTLPSELRQRLNFHYVSLQEEKQQQQQQ